MSRTAHRRSAASRRTLLTVSCGCATFAFVAAYLAKGSFAVAGAAAIGVALAPLVAVTPVAAVALLVCVNLTGLVETVPFAATGSLLLGIAAIAYSAYAGRLTLRWSPVFTAALLLVGANAISVVNARAPDVTTAALKSELRDLLAFAVIAVLLSSVRDFRAVVWAGALAAGALAGITIVHEVVLHNHGTIIGLSHIVGGGTNTTSARQTGPLLDPNFWARVLILTAPLALSLAAFEQRVRLRLLALGVAAVIGVGIVLTESRGGMVGLGIAVVAWLVLAGRRYLFLLLAVPLMVNVLLLTPVAGPRLDTLLDPAKGATAPTDYSIAQREAIARVSTRLIEAHPVLGVGYGNFGVAAKDDEQRRGEDAGLTAAHNLYLQLAAEGGVIGLLTWFAFVGSAAFAFGRSWMLNRRRRGGARRRSCEEWLAIGGLASLIGWSTASLFLHLAEFRSLLVVIALAVALDVVARDDCEHDLPIADGHDPVPAARKRTPVRRLEVLVTLVVVAVVAGTAADIWPPRTSHWEATTTLGITPSGSTTTSLESFRYTVLSGDFVQRTFSVMLETNEFVRKVGIRRGLTPAQIDTASVDVSGSSESGQLTVAVGAPDRQIASTLVAAVANTGASRVSSLQTNYKVSTARYPTYVTRVSGWDLAHINIAVLLVDLFVVCAVLASRRRRRIRDTALVV